MAPVIGVELPKNHFFHHSITISSPWCAQEQDGKFTLQLPSYSTASLTSINSLTCRQRKLKCDEKKPVCGQCCKASRECVPSSGIVFRHQHNASMNGDDSGDENTLKGFYAYKNTFDDDAVWMDIPKQGGISCLKQCLCSLFLTMYSSHLYQYYQSLSRSVYIGF